MWMLQVIGLWTDDMLMSFFNINIDININMDINWPFCYIYLKNHMLIFLYRKMHT